MALYLDSASADDARKAADLGFVAGITTNPSLVAKAGRSPLDVVSELCDLHPGTVFYQPVARSLAEREAEARRVAALRPGRVGVKLPSIPENFALAHRLVAEGFVVGMTAIFSAGQVYLACQAGVDFVIPYVNRSTRQLGDGVALVRAMRMVIDRSEAGPEILAASIKSPNEAVDSVLAGAHSLTLPLALILELGRHELSDRAIAEFDQAAGSSSRASA